MEYFSLKRSSVSDPRAANLSSKVYVRSTKSGRVQKIVKEVYLRQDIPCSSTLCQACMSLAPTGYSQKGWHALLQAAWIAARDQLPQSADHGVQRNLRSFRTRQPPRSSFRTGSISCQTPMPF